MKRIAAILLSFLLIISSAACGITPQNAQRGGNSSVSPDEGNTSNTKTLVVYFSWSGNTGEMAEVIAAQTDADIFEIVPVNPYPDDYNECTEAALAERDENARPEIRNMPESLDEYERIFIGFPIWWHTAPMIIGTFLEAYNLSGVEVYPFTQSASMNEEQFENSMDFVRECAKDADVHDGLFARATDLEAISAYVSQTEK